MKKLISLSLALLMVFSLVACGSSTSTTEKAAETSAAVATAASESATEAAPVKAEYLAQSEPMKIALVASNAGGAFWQPIQNAFEAQCAALGIEGSYMSPATEADDAAILDLCETALIQGFNVIACVINDKDMFADFLNRAKEQGVLVLGFNCDPGEDIVMAKLGIDSYQSGRQQGEQIAKKANEMGLSEINYYCLWTSYSNPAQKKTKQGVLDALSENFKGTINELGEGESGGNSAAAQDACSALYIAKPTVNTIVCLEAYSTVGAGTFIQENGLEGKIICYGLGLSADDLNRVKSGALMGTSSVDTNWMGTNIVNLAKTILDGGDYEYNNFPDKIWVFPDQIEAFAKERGIDL